MLSKYCYLLLYFKEWVNELASPITKDSLWSSGKTHITSSNLLLLGLFIHCVISFIDDPVAGIYSEEYDNSYWSFHQYHSVLITDNLNKHLIVLMTDNSINSRLLAMYVAIRFLYSKEFRFS